MLAACTITETLHGGLQSIIVAPRLSTDQDCEESYHRQNDESADDQKITKLLSLPLLLENLKNDGRLRDWLCGH